MRADRVVSEFLSVTRNRAQFIIEAGLVTYAGKLVTKPAFDVVEKELLSIDQDDPRVRYVSRSAVKLAKYLEKYQTGIVQDSSCLDIGASTGGFTQVLLEFGANSVVAVDVGTLQLDQKLRDNPRVKSFEQTDIRDFSRATESTFGIITVDVSFIPLEEILPSIARLLAKPDGKAFVLFKPQFQVGRERLRKTGVVRDIADTKKSLIVFETALQEHGLTVIHGPVESDLPGEAGNQEWMYTLSFSKKSIS